MMTVKCPKCATLLKFQPQASAARIKCPKCTTLLQVPGQASKPAAPTQTRPATAKPKATGQPTKAGQSKAAAKATSKRKPAATQPAASKKQPQQRSAPRQKAAPTNPDPLAAPAPGGFDLANLDLPEPTAGGGFASPGVDPLATPPAGGGGLPPGLPPAPAQPTLRPRAVPVAGKKPGPAKPKGPSKPGASKKSNSKAVLWIGLAAAGLLLMLTVGGLVIYMMRPSETTAQRSPASEEAASSESTAEASSVADDTSSSPDAASENQPPPDEPSNTPPQEQPDGDGPSDQAPSIAASTTDASQDTAESGGDSPVSTAAAGEFTSHSVGAVSASFPPGKKLEDLPTGIEAHAVYGEATKSTFYIAVGKVDPEITDQEKFIPQVERLVMADIYPGDPCQRSGQQGIQGRLSTGLIYPNMDLEIYRRGEEVIIIGWGRPQHEVDLFTPLILQGKKPPVEFDPQVMEAEKKKFFDSITF